MPDITREFNPATLRDFEAGVAALSGPQMERAQREALGAAGLKSRTQVRRALRLQVNAKAAKDINDRTRSVLLWDQREFRIIGINKALPIERVQGLAVRSGAGGGVVAAPWQVLRQFQRSFEEHGHYLARLGPGRFPLRRLWGPNVNREMVVGDSRSTFERYAVIELEAQMTRRIERLLAR